MASWTYFKKLCLGPKRLVHIVVAGDSPDFCWVSPVASKFNSYVETVGAYLNFRYDSSNPLRASIAS